MAILVSVAAYFAGKGHWPHKRPIAQKIKLVVLPFQNLSGDATQEYFTDGMTEEMITQLGRMQPERLGIIARTSAMVYKNAHKSTPQICRELGVDYVLEGSVRRAGDRTRITAQLIQCSDQTHLWADSSERNTENILALQADVARAITRQIQIKLSPRDQMRLTATYPINPEAYESYLKGRSSWYRSPNEIAKSVDYFRAAVEKQPDYALAYSGLAMSYAMLVAAPFNFLPPKEAMPQAKAAALKALKLDDSLAEAHTVLGFVRWEYEWDWRGADEEFNQALAVQPSYLPAHLSRTWLLLALNRPQEAWEQIQRAQEVAQESDPFLLVLIRAQMAHAFYFARQYDRVIEECRKASELNPDWPPIYFLLARAYEQKGLYDQAVTELEKARASFPLNFWLKMELGRAYGLAGRRADSLKQLGDLLESGKRRYVPATYILAIYLGLDDKDETLRWLEKAAQEHSEGLPFLNVDPIADPLRSEPRFQDLLRRMNLPLDSATTNTRHD